MPFSRGNMMQLPPSPLPLSRGGEGNVAALMRDKRKEGGISSVLGLFGREVGSGESRGRITS
jgi:hypothetical protein